MPELELEAFTCERDDSPLFEPLDLAIEPGEIVQVAGPNGAGKTTLLRALCGLFTNWKGRFSWRGNVLRRPNFDMLDQMLYLGHHPGVKRSLTARENLQWYFGVQGRVTPDKVENILAHVGLAGYADIQCQNMSAGQMRRVALARLYATQAKLWVLDEPFTAIDVKGVEHLENLIENHSAKGGTVLLTTHQALSIPSFRTVHLVPFVQGQL